MVRDYGFWFVVCTVLVFGMAVRESSIEDILSRIRHASKRVTVAKRTVAQVLAEATGHLSADAITVAVQEREPDVSPSTIYRILEEFEELGIIVHAHLGQGAAVFHLAGAVHGHLTCEICKQTFEIPSTHFDDLSHDLLESYGFELDRHHVALSGTCAQCRAPGSTPHG
jgi:Fur family ferric uptake transcriptional regulator